MEIKKISEEIKMENRKERIEEKRVERERERRVKK